MKRSVYSGVRRNPVSYLIPFLLALVVLGLFGYTALAQPNEVWVEPTVSEDVYHYDSLAEALDVVAPGGTVYIAAGEYVGHATITKDGLKLKGPGAGTDARGRSGPEAVIIGSIVVTSDASEVTIDGLTFQAFGGDNPYGLGGPYNTALVCEADSAVIVNNVFRGAESPRGPYTYSSLVNVNATDLTFRRNDVRQVIDVASDPNAAYLTVEGWGEIEDNTFAGALGIGVKEGAATSAP
ncbi:MAG: hypothetical protein NUV93_00085, partial [Firmicutes bacterium]|nr:hypothetical protein [Bacillota bacterium]